MRGAQPVGKAAASPAGIMLTGEPGTGRGLVARAIHACAHNGNAPWWRDCWVPCRVTRVLASAMAKAGAGTGPRRSAAGVSRPSRSLLHAARGGTIVFRNLDELPQRVQARLARLFRDREFKTRANGGAQVFAARPTAIVEPGFHALVDEGRVRTDLYRRVAEFQIRVPSLRERREDIAALAQVFVSRACQDLNIEEKPWTQRPDRARRFPWRGTRAEMKDLLEASCR
jgi:DNA-binding NtrC family response regulator